MSDELKMIKKCYGEKMAHLCRSLFPVILEEPGVLLHLLLDNYDRSHLLIDDILEWDGYIKSFKDHIYSSFHEEKKEYAEVAKTPAELMSEAGYILKECHSEEEIQAYKKYYAANEELCTFQGDRLNRCRVFFAVKKDVDSIKREDFKNPEREDLYGTSVISIQFTKDGSNTLSIKNRYNHRVINPDATFLII